MIAEALLVITFYSPSGEPMTLDGWYPREQPSMEICLERKANVEEVLIQPVADSKQLSDVKVTCEPLR